MFALIDRERQWAVDYLAAAAEWADLRRLQNRRSQRDRVRMTKACQTIAFFHLVLGELKEASSWDEAEFLAGLALLCIEAMSQRQRITQAADRAHQALTNAERHRKQGTRDPILEAGLLSIRASTLADEGHVPQAVDALEKCEAIYRDRSERALLGLTLVQKANILAGMAPGKGLAALDDAIPLIPAEDSQLRLSAEMLRVECLIEVCKPSEALQVFRRSSHLLAASPKVRPRIRGRFTGARLLDVLGYKLPAERLFDEVVDRDIEHEFYKDAFLDLLYLYGRHMKAGEIEKAVRVCRKALTDPSLSAIAHDQMRTVWEQLLAATDTVRSAQRC